MTKIKRPLSKKRFHFRREKTRREEPRLHDIRGSGPSLLEHDRQAAQIRCASLTIRTSGSSLMDGIAVEDAISTISYPC